MTVQWAHLGAGEVLVTSDESAWLQPSPLDALGIGGAGSLAFAGQLALVEPMPELQPASVASTRHLLDGAIAAADRVAPPAGEPPLTARRWAWSLVSQWHCAHHSVDLLPEVAERYRELGRPELEEFALLKLEEEHGHDEFSLSDLCALGYDARGVVDALEPMPAVSAVLAYARECVRGEQPVEFLGYVYALERRVLRLSEQWFAAVDAVLPPGVDAASGARKHAMELDDGHVAEAIEFFNQLPANDRTQIAIGCYRTTQISCTPPSRHPSESELEVWFAPFELRQGRGRTVVNNKEKP